jgi:hypothetical protein
LLPLPSSECGKSLLAYNRIGFFAVMPREQGD